ncbi:MAG TPA: tetratricopeptide repeat protein, partial [Anaerolineae bacterium]
TMGSRTALPRQQTLRATIDWSYELLTASERVLLQRLSVFVGGWTIEAAEQVGAGDEIEKGGVLDFLSQLVNKSLVEVDEGSPPRYRLLETIQEYVREKLVESGESDKTRTRHLRLFLNLAEEAEPHLYQANQLMWYGKLDTEYANLRAAIQWALESKRAEDGLRLTGALVQFWMGRGVFSEARKWLEATLASGRGASDSARVKVLQGLGATMRIQGDRASAHNFLEESLAMSRTLNDKKDIPGVLGSLAILALEEGDNDLARKYMEESLALGRELDDKWTIAYSLNLLGIAVRNQGDYDSAKSLWQESMRMLKELGSERQLAFLLVSMGDLAAREGNFSAEERMYEQALEIRSKLKDKFGIAQSLRSLGFSALHQRDLVRATALIKESLVLQNEIGNQAGIGECLVQLAFIAVEESKRKTVRTKSGKQKTTGMNQVARRSQLARAVRLVAATERRHNSLMYRGLDNLNRTITLLRSELDQAAFASAWAEGQAMTLEQAVEYALEETPAGAKET